MVLCTSASLTGITILAYSLFLLSALTPTLSQTSPIDPSTPTVAECGPRLLPLASCAPYVQGQAPGPSELCCDNLKEMYSEQHGCLCLFLNGTALATLPINSTLALQLPGLCSPQIDPSTCSPSVDDGSAAPPGPPDSQVSFKKKPPRRSPPTVPRPKLPGLPPITVAPGPRTPKSSAYKLRSIDQLGVVVALIPLLLAKLM